MNKIYKDDSAHFLKAFINGNGDYGDVASIVIDEGRHIADAERQIIARKLNTGETIFVNDLDTADISVVHPQGEIGFAGVGVVAAAWFLAKLRGKPTKAMYARDGKITARQEDGLTWCAVRLL